MLEKLDYRELILKLKRHFSVTGNKELADKLGITEDGIKNWTRNKKIPEKYLKLLDNENKIIKNNGNNNININSDNIGQIHINSGDEMSMEICKCIKKLSDKRKEYYYHKIKAEILEMEEK